MLSRAVLWTISQYLYIYILLNYYCRLYCAPMQIKLLYCYRIVCSEDELHGRRLDAVQLYDHRERKTARSGGSTGRRRWLQSTGI